MIRGNAPLLRVMSSLYPQSTNVPVLYAIMKYPIPVNATNIYIITSGVPFFANTVFLLILILTILLKGNSINISNIA